MENLEFSVPYNHDPETLKEIFALKRLGKNNIREIYLSGPQEYSAAGRISPALDLAQLIEIVDLIHKEGIRVNLVLNATCEGIKWYQVEVMRKKMEYLKLMHKEHGVEAVTIANPLYIKEIRRWFPDLEICASVLSDIDCVERAVLYSRFGANVITPDININRDLKLLKEIKEATNAELKLVANEGCLYKCPFRKFHFNAVSHESLEPNKVGPGDNYFFNNCHQVTSEDHSQILKSGWIRPEDTRKYSEITSFFKIVGRAKLKSMVVRTTKAYLEETWDGDLLDIVSSSLNMFGLRTYAHLDNKSLGKHKFFEKITSCDRNCGKCSYCEELAGKLIRLKVHTRIKMEDMGLKDDADILEKLGKLS